MSKYEERILKILLESGFSFEREKTFQDLKNGKLRYDFYLPLMGGILIECDGEQHFGFVKKFYKKRKDYLAALERDRKKNAYALSHNLTLYRIPYYDVTNLKRIEDLFRTKYKVKSIYHNDLLLHNNSNGIKK